jgi:hypothetical protein
MILGYPRPGLNKNPFHSYGFRLLGVAVVLGRLVDLVISSDRWQGCAEAQLDDELAGLAIFSVD